METGEWRPRREGQFANNLARLRVARGDCDGTTGCTYANKNANAWETGPGPRASDVGGVCSAPGVVSGMKVVRGRSGRGYAPVKLLKEGGYGLPSFFAHSGWWGTSGPREGHMVIGRHSCRVVDERGVRRMEGRMMTGERTD
jgi:hypothetical protein